jgi:hypothetical protein
MQRQGAFALLHQSANAGKMVNRHGKRGNWAIFRQAGQDARANRSDSLSSRSDSFIRLITRLPPINEMNQLNE